ncbi:MAG: hypothetical protein LBQ46_09620 [Treponema sp.]|jgi:hypothetical protein|nr:hypothetical protein [Treponema sp.]
MMLTRRGFFRRLPGLGALVLGLASCGASISGKLERGGVGDFNVSAALEPGAAAKIRDFLAFSQGNPGGGELLINAPAIARSMSNAPGVAQVNFRNTGSAALEGLVKIANIGDFLAPSGKAGFISFQENPGGGGRVAITLNREAAPDMLSLISPDVTYYLMALFAPIATGDELSKEEYLIQVNLFHGPAVAGEISRASVRSQVEFPGPLVSVRGGTFSGSRAEFIIPLADLLVLEQPLSYEAVWR